MGISGQIVLTLAIIGIVYGALIAIVKTISKESSLILLFLTLD